MTVTLPTGRPPQKEDVRAPVAVTARRVVRQERERSRSVVPRRYPERDALLEFRQYVVGDRFVEGCSPVPDAPPQPVGKTHEKSPDPLPPVAEEGNGAR